MLMSESQEKAIGAQSDPGIVQAYGLYEDDQMQAFINEKGQEMVKFSHRPDLEFNFKLLDSPVVNAFAVPGGYVYFTRGIMAHFNNEAEFAGVLGHEIGHVTARHSAKQYSNQMLAQVGLMVGVVANEKFREFAYDISQGVGLLFLKFGRDHESQSDELGVQYSTAAGYDAHEMADFFQTLNRLQQKAGVTIPDFLSTHPNPVNRYNKVHRHADKAQANMDKSKLKINRDSYLAMIDGMIYGDDPKQGYVDNNVFYHPELKFEFPFPQEWILQNTPSQVQIISPDNNALMIFTFAQGNTLEAAAQAATEQFNLTVLESQRTNVNGMPAYAMVSEQKPDPQANGPGQQQEPIRLMSYFIQYDQLIYVFHGISLKSEFNGYTQNFKQTMTSFKKLTDPRRINVQPTRLVIKTTNQSGPLNTILQRLGAEYNDLEELSIINGMTLEETVQSGSKLKLFSQSYNKG
ncbi:MAG: M48 family metalloprotease [Saprospiraceae bacterium]|nr:M48 family metalloprotease [Saprospiraceae bacterium]